MSHWELTCVCVYAIRSLHMAHIPGNWPYASLPPLCPFCASAAPVPPASQLQGSPLTCCSWGRTPLCSHHAPHSYSPCTGPCPVPSPPPHRVVLRARPKPYFYDNGTQHTACVQQAFTQGLPHQTSEQINAIVTLHQQTILKVYWVDRAVHLS